MCFFCVNECRCGPDGLRRFFVFFSGVSAVTVKNFFKKLKKFVNGSKILTVLVFISIEG